MEFSPTIFAVATFILIGIPVLAFVIYFYFIKTPDAPVQDVGTESTIFDVQAGFITPSFSDTISFGHNNANPVFILNKNTITTRALFRKQEHPYSAIQTAGYRSASRTHNIVIHFTDHWWNQQFNLLSPEYAAQALRILQDKGVPLTQDAQQLLQKEGGR